MTEQEAAALMRVYSGLVELREALWSAEPLTREERIRLGHICDGMHNIPYDIAKGRFFQVRAA